MTLETVHGGLRHGRGLECPAHRRKMACTGTHSLGALSETLSGLLSHAGNARTSWRLPTYVFL